MMISGVDIPAVAKFSIKPVKALSTKDGPFWTQRLVIETDIDGRLGIGVPLTTEIVLYYQTEPTQLLRDRMEELINQYGLEAVKTQLDDISNQSITIE